MENQKKPVPEQAEISADSSSLQLAADLAKTQKRIKEATGDTLFVAAANILIGVILSFLVWNGT